MGQGQSLTELLVVAALGIVVFMTSLMLVLVEVRDVSRLASSPMARIPIILHVVLWVALAVPVSQFAVLVLNGPTFRIGSGIAAGVIGSVILPTATLVPWFAVRKAGRR